MKFGKRCFSFLLTVLIAVNCLSTSALAATGSKGVIKKVSITKPQTETLVLMPKKSYQLKTKVEKKGKISSAVKYTSSNKKVATVSSKGKIKALKKGKTTITVISKVNKKKKAKLKVIVGTPVKAIKLNKSKVDAKMGAKIKLKATVLPKKATVKQVTFSTNNRKVATVDKNGTVTCKAAGTAKITVTAKDGSGKKAVCVINVKKKNKPQEQDTQKPDTPEQDTPKPDTPEQDTQTPQKDLSYDGYQLKWEDDFDGTCLNTDDWNYEEHDPGWVNSELQAYVASDDNVYVKDGKLVIQPVKKVNDKGEVSITSGRINTQGKHDFTYGLFEVRAKVPAGKGFLPAFWMMPTDENLYGQWPKCGEIDAMEVMGQETDKLYGTIHYGAPHEEKQGTYVLKEDNFADNYHTFSCEWEPGKITWYVDGIKYHEANDWFSAVEGEEELTYPAPFDQPFYMILNLAVGGSWVGYPDNDADYINTENFSIDYVKVYQKDSYDENVKKPEQKPVIIRDPDANGNYVNNGNFAKSENLSDDADWKFLTALEGEGQAEIKDGAIKITTQKAGTADYSIQLVQSQIPAERGGEYTLTFDAWADEAREMKVGVTAPDRSYKRYLQDTALTVSKDRKTYTYTYVMTDKTDANARVEFNLGNMKSTDTMYITNVSIKKTGQTELSTEKKPLSDGNYVYNGAFQQGENHLGDWIITNQCNAQIGVTDLKDERRLKITAQTDKENDVILSQTEIPLNASTEYALTFDAQADKAKDLQVTIAGQTFTANLTENTANYSFIFKTTEQLKDADKVISFMLGNQGIIYLDNIRVVENTLIKNGSFKAGFSGYEVYADASASMTSVVDSLTEDYAADFTIKDTGDQAWKIQLKQNNIPLEKGQWYRLSLKAKSDMNRKLMFALQRDGSNDDDWTPYSGEKIVDLTNDYQTFTLEFKMKNETDLKTILSISMGAVGGVQITQQHRICIDDILLEKIDEPEIGEVEAGVNLLKNTDFTEGENGLENWGNNITAPAVASSKTENKKLIYDIQNAGDEEWHVQLKQSGLIFEKDETYEVTYTLKSTEARKVKIALMSTTYDWYGGADINLPKDEEVKDTFTFTMKTSDEAADFVLSLGKMADEDTPASMIEVSGLSVKKMAK